jgi:magnesium chelatase family protein
MLVKTYGSAVEGIHATLITIEVNVAKGEFGLVIVGLPDNAVKESWARIMTAFKNNDLKFPRSKVVVNMAPADLRKVGSGYDLPIALGVLAASGEISASEISIPKQNDREAAIVDKLDVIPVSTFMEAAEFLNETCTTISLE